MSESLSELPIPPQKKKKTKKYIAVRSEIAEKDLFP